MHSGSSPITAPVDTVHVWLVRADLPAADLGALLDEEERQRAAALTDARHQHRFTVAHGAARLILGRHLGVPPAQIRFGRGRHGKPVLVGAWTGLHVSLSHSGPSVATKDDGWATKVER